MAETALFTTLGALRRKDLGMILRMSMCSSTCGHLISPGMPTPTPGTSWA
ncbi:MAG TPA: hypothetical protein VGK53_20570 [Propionicimonas sp.]|jgi:hypothetical protein